MRQKQIEIDTRFLTSYAQLPNGTTTDAFIRNTQFNHKKDIFPPSIKASIRAYAPDEVTIRLINLHDTKDVNVSLVDSNENIGLLSYLSGFRTSVQSSEILEVSLSTVMSKKDALAGKFEIREAGKINLDDLLIKGNEMLVSDGLFLI